MSKTCLECGKPFNPRSVNTEFHSPACRQAFNNRRAQRGAVLYDMAMVRLLDKQAFDEYGFRQAEKDIVRQWAEEDKDAGRRRSYRHVFDIRYTVASLLRR